MLIGNFFRFLRRDKLNDLRFDQARFLDFSWIEMVDPEKALFVFLWRRLISIPLYLKKSQHRRVQLPNN